MADGTIRDVVDLWYSAADLAGLPGLPSSERRVRSRAETDGWVSRARRGLGGGREYQFGSLPCATQAALLLREGRAPARPNATCARKAVWTEQRIASAWQHYEAVTQPLKDTARRRLGAIHAVEALTSAGTPMMRARAIVAAQLQRDGVRGSTPASICRWQSAIDGAHRSDWLALLVPHYAGRTKTAPIDPEAWEIFKGDFLRLEAPSASSCYDRLQRIAGTKHWDALPCLSTFLRRIERELPRQVRVLAREGEEALDRCYPAQERDRSMFAALEGVNADGHRWDFFARLPDGKVARVIILAWQDLYSGKILSYRLCDNESSDVVRLSYADMVRDYGIPLHAWLDNGRAFASKWMTGGVANRYRFKVRAEDPVGLLVACGTEIHWVTPYRGQAKPIERTWREFCDRIAKHPAFAGAYAGNNPTAKPENYGSRAVPWETVERVVAQEIAAHNARVGRRTKVCAGVRSFDQAFAESYANTTIRKATSEQLRSLLLAAEAVTADQRDGSVRLAGNRYWSEALSRHAGQKLVLRIDPQNLHGSAYVYALDGTYLAEAPCVASVGFADTQAAREHARGKQQYRRAAKAMLAAERLMDAAAVAAQMPDTPVPENLPAPAAIAPVFRHHGARRPAASTDLAATGTDDARAARLGDFLSRQLDKLQEDAI